MNFTGGTFALATYIFTEACIRVVYINKFVARHENLFYRKYSLEKKQRLMNNVKRENEQLRIFKSRYTLFFYKNILYKNIEAEICEILRIF